MQRRTKYSSLNTEQKIKDDLFQGNEDAYYLTENAFAFAASAMIPIGQASTAGNLTFKSTATIVAKEGISMGAGAGAQKITTDVTGNDTAGMVAGMVASGVTAKGLNGIEAEANKLAKAPKGIDGVTEEVGNLAEDVGKAGKGLEGAAKGAESAAEDAGKAVESGTTTVIYGSDDIANYQYNMIENPGPLAEMPNQPAKNFYGGRYNMEVLQEDRIMYRAGNAQNPYGRWFTSEPPASVANVRIDTAVKTHWIDPKTGAYEASSYIDNVYAIKVPKGTTIYTGPVGPQGGVYVGGYNVMQTYIDAPWTFEVVGKTPLQ